MSRHILITDDGTPIIASKAAVMDRATEEFGGLSFETLRQFSVEKLASAGIWLNVPVRSSSLLAYQKLSSPVAHYDDVEAWIERAAVDEDLEVARERAIGYLASKRWAVETSGTYVGQLFIDTRREVVGIVSHHYHKAQADPNHEVQNFKVGKTLFAPLNAQQIIGISNAFEAHVQACFTREAELMSFLVSAASVEDLRAVDLDSGWPSNSPPEE